MRNLTRGAVVVAATAGLLALAAPASAGDCVSAPGSNDVLIYVAKPVPMTVNDPGTVTVSPMECTRAVREAVSL